MDDSGTFWTLQQFTTITGKPWYALQKQNDGGVERQYTGYRHEMDDLAAKLGVVPQLLPPTTEQEFFSRADGDVPDESHVRALTNPLPGRGR